MKRALIAVFLLAAGSLSAQAQELKWVEDYELGLKEARENGKPIFVLFCADW